MHTYQQHNTHWQLQSVQQWPNCLMLKCSLTPIGSSMTNSASSTRHAHLWAVAPPTHPAPRPPTCSCSWSMLWLASSTRQVSSCSRWNCSPT
jgi:hypothetical protein